MHISLLVHTASDDDHVPQFPSYFVALTNNLADQTFKDFELIYTDRFYENNKTAFAEQIKQLPYSVKHVPVHHRYWIDNGNTFISAGKNTGILHAQGKLLITQDDARLYDKDYLEKTWYYYSQHNAYLNAIYTHWHEVFPGYPISGTPTQNECDKNGDFRLHLANQMQRGIYFHARGDLLWAGTTFTLEQALTLNGFNERMDGAKGLEDCEFGHRLQLLGVRFVLDSTVRQHIIEHKSYQIQEWLPMCCGVHDATKQYKLLVANKDPYTPEQLETIRQGQMREHPTHFDCQSAPYKEKYERWLNTPTFDLRQERQELHS